MRAPVDDEDAAASSSSATADRAGAFGARTRVCYGVLTFDDRRESQRKVPTCYGAWFRSERALPRERRTLLTGDVLGRYKYTCAGAARRAAPFYKERTPTMEDRKRGTEFPYCTGLEILVAEKVVDRRGEREGARGGGATSSTTSSRPEGVDVEVVLDDARDEDGVTSANARHGGERVTMSDALDRFNRSAGKITRNMSRHANFIADGVLSLILGRR